MRLGQDVLSDLERGLGMEWLFGNGLGGSISGTALGASGRRTHAHLAIVRSHGLPLALLLGAEERLHVEATVADLGTHPSPTGGARPAGYRLLEEFRLDPWPVWRFRSSGVTIEKSLFMVYGHHAAVIRYRHLGGPNARLTVSPLSVARELRSIQRENPEARGALRGPPGRVRIEFLADDPALTLWHDGVFLPARVWHRQLWYAEDAREGLETGEDALVAGYVEASLAAGGSLDLVASAEDDLLRALAREDRLGVPPPRTLAGCVDAIERDERERIAAWRSSARAGARITARQAREAHAPKDAGGARGPVDRVPVLELDDRASYAGRETTNGRARESTDDRLERLADALRLGLVRRGGRLTLIDTLPGGAERGDATLRALQAVITLRGFEIARDILQGVIEYLDEGFAPEGFDPEDGRPRYGDPAVSLWLVIVAELYARRSQDLAFAKDTLYPALEGVMRSYRSGTKRGVRVGADGLLIAGEGPEARVRADLNALWHQASIAIGHLARTAGRREDGAFYLAWAQEQQRRFNEAFWNERSGGLIRARDPEGATIAGGPDPSHLLAVSIAPRLLPPERAARLVQTIQRKLFTPLGLRAKPAGRTVATSWLAPFYSAYLRVHGRDAAAQAWVSARLDELSALDRGVWGHVPAEFELDRQGQPIHGSGEVSILAAAELLRLEIEELDRAGVAEPELVSARDE